MSLFSLFFAICCVEMQSGRRLCPGCACICLHGSGNPHHMVSLSSWIWTCPPRSAPRVDHMLVLDRASSDAANLVALVLQLDSMYRGADFCCVDKTFNFHIKLSCWTLMPEFSTFLSNTEITVIFTRQMLMKEQWWTLITHVITVSKLSLLIQNKSTWSSTFWRIFLFFLPLHSSFTEVHLSNILVTYIIDLEY